MYEVVIVGGGPGGLTAGIYLQRARRKTLLLEKTGLGGQIAVSDIIENYPGFPHIGGMELGQKFEEHARGLGLEIQLSEVVEIKDEGNKKVVRTPEKSYETKAVVVASGAYPRKLGVKGEEEFAGRGVSYCATCDGAFFPDKDVVVVGGGDTAVKEALYLVKIAKKISLVHRRDQLRAEKILQERAFETSKIEFVWNSVLEGILGNQTVEEVIVRDVKTEEKKKLKSQGVFIFVGVVPYTDFVDVKKDEGGFIITDENMKTSVPGIYAVGDCRTKLSRQVATAVGDGATAAMVAEEYLESLSS